MIIESTFINAGTHNYEAKDGRIVTKNSLLTEGYARIITPVGTYPFNPTFGCQLPNRFNTRNQVTANVIIQDIQEAWTPMINDGRVLGMKVSVTAITLSGAFFIVSGIDNNNQPFTLPVNYLAGAA